MDKEGVILAGDPWLRLMSGAMWKGLEVAAVAQIPCNSGGWLNRSRLVRLHRGLHLCNLRGREKA